MVAPAIEIPTSSLAQFCRRYGIRKLSLFGSVIRPDFGATSDVDVLVEFQPGRTPGLAFVDLQDELSAIFGGRQIDLVTEKSLNRRIRQSVLDSAIVLHEE